MRFATLIFKNILRRKTRSAFTLLGISIGIATIVALGAVMNGMTASMEGILKSGEADFSIAQSGISDLSFSRIDENTTGKIQDVAGVRKNGHTCCRGIVCHGRNRVRVGVALSETHLTQALSDRQPRLVKPVLRREVPAHGTPLL